MMRTKQNIKTASATPDKVRDKRHGADCGYQRINATKGECDCGYFNLPDAEERTASAPETRKRQKQKPYETFRQQAGKELQERINKELRIEQSYTQTALKHDGWLKGERTIPAEKRKKTAKAYCDTQPYDGRPIAIPADKPTTWKQQADKQLSGLIATLEKMATCEAAAGDGMFATDHLSNIRYVLDKLYEAKDAMEVL